VKHRCVRKISRKSHGKRPRKYNRKATPKQSLSELRKKYPHALEYAKQKDGVREGRLYKTPDGVVEVKTIHRGKGHAWSARVKNFDKGYQTAVPLKDLAKLLRTRTKHPVAGCYAIGKGRVRRLKVNRRRRRRNPVQRFYIFARVRKGRGWLRYNTQGNFSGPTQPHQGRDFATVDQAKQHATHLRRRHPRELGNRTLAVSDRWPDT
jgi:hypothetical protein